MMSCHLEGVMRWWPVVKPYDDRMMTTQFTHVHTTLLKQVTERSRIVLDDFYTRCGPIYVHGLL